MFLAHSNFPLMTGDIPKSPTLIQKAIMRSASAFAAGDLDAAMGALDDALTLYPDDFTKGLIWQAMSVLFTQQKNWPMAEMYCDLSLQKQPKNADYISQRGTIAMLQHNFDEAFFFMDKAMVINKTAKVLTNYGSLLIEINRPDLAEKQLKKALAKMPQLPEAHLNLSFALMAQGKYDEAWQHQEYRFLTHSGMGYSSFAPPWPIWRGEPLKNKTLYIKTEQGKGDTLKYMRYINFVRHMGAEVIIDCDNDMRPLLEIVFHDCQFVIPNKKFDEKGLLIHADYWIWLMSIGQFWHGYPKHTPYVVSGLQEPRDERFTVGLCWKGNPDQGDDWKRSIHGSEMEDFHDNYEWMHLLDDPHSLAVNFKCLQFGEHGFKPGDWFETSQHIEACDLVITVDTSIAHLAGAMNKPTWVLLSAAPSYHYPPSGETNPWYPSQKLYRQEGIENLTRWEKVLEKVGQDLRALLQSKR